MKRTIWIALLFCVILSACSSGRTDISMQSAVNFRTALMEAAGCSYQAQVTADYGERIYEFNLLCEYVPDAEARVTVISPEMISGISATISSDGAKIEFDGAELDFGVMANGNVAPMSLPWIMGRAWSSEYIRSVGIDDAFILVSYLMGYGDDEILVETWFADDRTPVRCDISYAGMRCISASISDFKLH